MKRVALITCRVLPEPDPDQDILLAALRAAGVHAEMLPWDDPKADAATFDLCVMRSCWNYYEDPVAFAAWVARTARVSRLVNDRRAVDWNLHKRYLALLLEGGVPIIPTAWFVRGGAHADLDAQMRANDWDDVVIKPAISAASFRTRRFRRGKTAEGQRFLETIMAERDAMVQRYVPGFETTGERALVWIDGAFTHAVRKEPRYDGQDESVSEGLPVSGEDRALGERALALVGVDLVYARVDVVDLDGSPVVSEVELMEPSLFFLQSPAALDRFVRAIVGLTRR